MEQYTLNRFYFEAKAVIEKYQLQGKEDYEFKVDFSIEEDRHTPGPVLRCGISYCHKQYDSKEPSYYGFGVTPYICLGEFEEALKKATGKSLIENLAVEIEN